MAAALVMAAYLFVMNLFFVRSAWYAPRLFAALVLEILRFRCSPEMAVIIGYSVLFFVSGIQGLIFGLVVPPGVGSIWSANIGVILSLGWYLVLLRAVVVVWARGLLLRFTQPSLLLAYFLFGAIFVCYPALHTRLARPVEAGLSPAVSTVPPADAVPAEPDPRDSDSD